ncbi:hypothetical protein RFI_27878 [Reticulomyxa filosa]|uniref:Uncharacterized protein n=1 Tax=Reticulomyxa filosa TaxID=46433 RepID=X6M679_RETFI|nr:hypothetical protein RFI_27878 [Reticulomyxa filosa]|eukprot:ETO09498.1 hypothetical protein RFI_27878 [Reticulomyxa filosa]
MTEVKEQNESGQVLDNTNTNEPSNNRVSENHSSSHLKNVEAPEMQIESEDEGENETILRLTSQKLSEIPADIAQTKGETVRTLVLTNNKIRSLANLQYFKRLETLQLDRNGMLDIDDMPKMPYLRTLWLNNNQLSDMHNLLKILAKNCPRLSYLSLLRNPVCPSIYFTHGNEDKYRRYRFTVLYHLHGLTYLDTTEVTQKEQKEALEKGKFLVVKKTFTTTS